MKPFQTGWGVFLLLSLYTAFECVPSFAQVAPRRASPHFTVGVGSGLINPGSGVQSLAGLILSAGMNYQPNSLTAIEADADLGAGGDTLLQLNGRYSRFLSPVPATSGFHGNPVITAPAAVHIAPTANSAQQLALMGVGGGLRMSGLYEFGNGNAVEGSLTPEVRVTGGVATYLNDPLPVAGPTVGLHGDFEVTILNDGNIQFTSRAAGELGYTYSIPAEAGVLQQQIIIGLCLRQTDRNRINGCFSFFNRGQTVFARSSSDSSDVSGGLITIGLPDLFSRRLNRSPAVDPDSSMRQADAAVEPQPQVLGPTPHPAPAAATAQ